MSDPVHISFGQWLKQQRKEAGITRDDLAERTSCSSETLQKIESGERRPSRQIALSLAELFHVPVDEQEAFVTFARAGTSKGSHSYPRSPKDSVAPPTSPTSPSLFASSPPSAPRADNQAAMYSPWRSAYLQHNNWTAPL